MLEDEESPLEVLAQAHVRSELDMRHGVTQLGPHLLLAQLGMGEVLYGSQWPAHGAGHEEQPASASPRS